MKKARRGSIKGFGLLAVAFLLVLSMAFTGCQTMEKSEKAMDFEGRVLTLVTTTSTENSGLLDAILPAFKSKYNCDVKVVAVGSGAAFEMAQQGEADVIVVHAPKSEEQFMADGFGRERFPLMYNDFVVIGPGEIGALNIDQSADVLGALKGIQENALKFISRGDDSGTHKKELQLWEKAEITPEGDHYLSVGKGMGEVITMAEELQAYTLTDRATYLSMKDQLTLKVLVEGNDLLYNPYAVLTINKEKFPQLNHDMADAFASWLLSEETLKQISEFGEKEFGQPLFYLFDKK